MEIKENSQKRVLLSVLGVAILVVAVVGISFAAWSATQEGSENSVTTGTIMVSYQEDSQEINITGAVPMADAAAIADYTENNESFQFTVSTEADRALTIPYKVTFTPTTQAGEGQLALTDSQMRVNLTKSAGTLSQVYPATVGNLTAATGTRAGSYVLDDASHVYEASTGGSQTTTYVLKMWIDNSVDTSNDENKVYVYSAKVNVDSAVTPIS